MAGDLIECPYCQGWSPAETGWTCEACGGDGVMWNDEPDEDEEMIVVDAGDELHTILAEALSSAPQNKT